VPRIQRLPGGQLVVTIPKAIARFKGWKKGDEVIFKEDKTRGACCSSTRMRSSRREK